MNAKAHMLLWLLVAPSLIAPRPGNAGAEEQPVLPLPHAPRDSRCLSAEGGQVIQGEAWLTDTKMGPRQFHMHGAATLAFDLAALDLAPGMYHVGLLARTGTRWDDPVGQVPHYQLYLESEHAQRWSLRELCTLDQPAFRPVMDDGVENSWANWFGAVQSARPVSLQGDERLVIENTGQHGGVWAVWVQPVSPLNSVTLTLSTDAPLNAFPFGTTPTIHLRTELPDGLPSVRTSVTMEWLDLLSGEAKCERLPLVLAPGEDHVITRSRPLPPGVYRVRARIEGAGDGSPPDNESAARLLLACAPARRARELPDDWPLGAHVSASIPPLDGFRWYRYFAQWAEVNPARGRYEWQTFDKVFQDVRQVGGRLLIASDGSPLWTTARGKAGMEWCAGATAYPPDDWSTLGDYLQALLTRYADEAGTLGALELCNEANTKERWLGEPEQLAEMARTFRAAVTASGSRASVIGIAASAGDHRDYVRRAVEAGVLDYVDAVSAHFYEELMSYENNVPGSSLPRHIAMLQDPMEKAGSSLPMMNSESGIAFAPREQDRMIPQNELNQRAETNAAYDPAQPWLLGTYWRRVSERRAAASYVSGAIMLMASGVKRSFVFTQESFIVDGAPSLPWVALGQLGSLLFGVDYKQISPLDAAYVNAEKSADAPKAMAFLLGKTGGNQLIVAWGYRPDGKIGRSKLWQPWLSPATMTIKADVQDGKLMDLYDRRRTTVRSQDGRLEIPCGEEPVFISLSPLARN